MKLLNSSLKFALALGLSAAFAGADFVADGRATSDTSGKKIAFSNSDAGNSLRQVRPISGTGRAVSARSS
jgi:ribose transport system substrate-binding protein